MKTKRFFYSLLLLFIGSTLNLQAQVVIGDAVVPQSFSALEVISNGTGGLRLPQLTNAQRAAVQTAIEALAPAEQPKAKGLMIFNLDTKCVNTWNGTEWISNCAGLVGSIGSLDCSGAAITAISGAAVNVTKTLTYSDLTGTVSVTDGQELGSTDDFSVVANGDQDLTDPSGTINIIITGTAPAASTSIPVELAGADCSISVTPCVTPTISAYSPTGRGIVVADGGSTVTTFGVTASGTGPFSYQWYKASSAVNSGGKAQSDATSATFTTPSDLVGTNYYYCVVTGDCGSINSDIFTIASGCGAYIAGGQWLEFKCHNLGANESADPFAYNTDILGDYYQWGRRADGHEKSSSPVVMGPASSSDLDANGQIRSGSSFYGKFIITNNEVGNWRTPSDFNLWGTTKTVNDPCPDGWKVPSIQQWSEIVNNNTWTWTGNGYMVGTGLYLPATGFRVYLNIGPVNQLGTRGCYWSSTISYWSWGSDSGYGANALDFQETFARADLNATWGEAYGRPIRCVKIQ